MVKSLRAVGAAALVAAVVMSMPGGIWGHGAEEAGKAAEAMGEATPGQKVADHGMYTPADLKWQAGPEALPAGAQMAVLEGNPAEAGPFTIRVKVPDGYRIPPHTHPGTEHVTVLSGTLLFGMGDRFDEKALRALPAGSFAYMKPGLTHFVQTKGETVVQLHGEGPWGIRYVNPADDPRGSKTALDGR